MEFLTVIFSFVAIGYVYGQSTVQVTVQPPNCVSATQQQQSNVAAVSSSQNNGMRGFGRKQRAICTNVNQNYTSKVDLVNAMATNQGLGTRPCRMGQMNAMQNNQGTELTPSPLGNSTVFGRGYSRGRGDDQRSQNRQACFTNGQSGSGQTIMQTLQQNPSVGIRCQQSCPCPALQCPRTGGRGRRN